jgi:hypothetical protein
MSECGIDGCQTCEADVCPTCGEVWARNCEGDLFCPTCEGPCPACYAGDLIHSGDLFPEGTEEQMV